MHADIRAIEYHLPEAVLGTAQLAAEFPGWGVEKIDATTGIQARYQAAPGECASDLAFAAAQKLFRSGAARPEEIDFVLLCSQTPDYFLPSTACLLQHRLGIPTSAGALDFNLGSSGYVYGLGLAEGLIATGQASRILLLTADTYSRFVHPADRTVRTIFGDAAAATLLCAAEGDPAPLGPFLYGTDGRGAGNLIVPAGAMRIPHSAATAQAVQDEEGNWRSPENVFMNGMEIFQFTLRAAPASVQGLLEKAGLDLDAIDLFVFHQANRYILEQLRRRLKIPAEKFQLAFHCGNTVSCTLPIALKQAASEGRLPAGARVMLVGFGVGYSWGATIWRCGGVN